MIRIEILLVDLFLICLIIMTQHKATEASANDKRVRFSGTELRQTATGSSQFELLANVATRLAKCLENFNIPYKSPCDQAKYNKEKSRLVHEYITLDREHEIKLKDRVDIAKLSCQGHAISLINNCVGGICICNTENCQPNPRSDPTVTCAKENEAFHNETLDADNYDYDNVVNPVILPPGSVAADIHHYYQNHRHHFVILFLIICYWYI